MNDKRIPKRDLAKPVKFDRGNEVKFVEANDGGVRQDLDFLLSDFSRHAEFASCGGEVFLKHLHRHHCSTLAQMLRH